MYVTIAKCRGLEVKVPSSCWFSFFNSPYPAHKSSSAIDIYFPDLEALFPAEEGVVLEVEKFECPRFRRDADGFDYLTIIRVGDDAVLKILHVKPKVKPGERVSLGDYLGVLWTSGYFSPWSDLHMHIEVRPPDDAKRALGAFELDVSPAVRLISKPSCIGSLYTVYEDCGCYVWLRPSDCGGFMRCGLALYADGEAAFVDGGLPHYGYGAALNLALPAGFRLVDALGSVVGEVYRGFSCYSLFKALCEVYVGGLRVRGVGSYFNKPLLKVIKPSSWSFIVGDVVELKFKTDHKSSSRKKKRVFR
ncbi:MAG: M23 family metallopeptidase [archaeon GB-1867-005]|nr:M23 family metallopeptidase [Candidatus Culexmicrobium cathedralense]